MYNLYLPNFFSFKVWSISISMSLICSHSKHFKDLKYQSLFPIYASLWSSVIGSRSRGLQSTSGWIPILRPFIVQVQSSMCNMHYAMCNVQCAMCNVQCEMCNVQCEMCNVKCAMCNVQCAIYNMHMYRMLTWIL